MSSKHYDLVRKVFTDFKDYRQSMMDQDNNITPAGEDREYTLDGMSIRFSRDGHDVMIGDEAYPWDTVSMALGLYPDNDVIGTLLSKTIAEELRTKGTDLTWDIDNAWDGDYHTEIEDDSSFTYHLTLRKDEVEINVKENNEVSFTITYYRDCSLYTILGVHIP